MKNFKIVSTKIWIYFLCPIWSFIINLLIFIVNVDKINIVKKKKELLIKLPLNLVMKNFKWKKDNLKDWIPNAFTMIISDYEDDCDGSAFMANFWYKKHEINSKILYLFPENLKEGHCICIREDNSEFVSNTEIITIPKDYDWKQFILNYFNNQFYYIFEK